MDTLRLAAAFAWTVFAALLVAIVYRAVAEFGPLAFLASAMFAGLWRLIYKAL
jgi:hypothetical protein